MALLVCKGCTARYSVGAPKCPQCGSTEYVEEGAEDMAKITVHGGVSNAAAEDEAVEVGGDESSPGGTTSSTSSEAEPNSPETSEQPRPSRARSAGSRSKQARAEESSTAGATDTSGPETDAADDGKGA
jgi:RNA polymerase subunit RPABC4/transcription elongation factor Spt4